MTDFPLSAKEIEATATEGAPFSNSDTGYAWMAYNCDRCIYDAPARSGDDGNGCPLVLVALTNRTPGQWRRTPLRAVGMEFSCDCFTRDESVA